MKLLAFMKKDFLIAISYRFRIMLQFIGLPLGLFILYFISKTFSGVMSPQLARYGGNYFAFVLVGMAVSSFVSVGLGALAQEVRSAQVQGTLEALLSTPTSIYTILIGNSLWRFLMALVGALLILGVGFTIIKLQVIPINVLVAMLVLIITFIAFLTVGMLSAAFVMIFKQGNPIPVIFGSSSYFLGGVVFPVEVLPKVFQSIGRFLPITYAVKALRELLLARAGFREVLPLIGNLSFFIAVLLPVSILFFRFAVKRAMRDGSLIQF